MKDDIVKRIREIIKMGMGEKEISEDMEKRLCNGIMNFFKVDGVILVKLTINKDGSIDGDISSCGDEFIVENMEKILLGMVHKDENECQKCQQQVKH